MRHDAYLLDLASGKATKRVKNKRELIANSLNLVHGLSVSPDGQRSAYETRDYQLYLADGEGSNARHVQTGMSFNLLPEPPWFRRWTRTATTSPESAPP